MEIAVLLHPNPSNVYVCLFFYNSHLYSTYFLFPQNSADQMAVLFHQKRRRWSLQCDLLSRRPVQVTQAGGLSPLPEWSINVRIHSHLPPSLTSGPFHCQQLTLVLFPWLPQTTSHKTQDTTSGIWCALYPQGTCADILSPSFGSFQNSFLLRAAEGQGWD